MADDEPVSLPVMLNIETIRTWADKRWITASKMTQANFIAEACRETLEAYETQKTTKTQEPKTELVHWKSAVGRLTYIPQEPSRDPIFMIRWARETFVVQENTEPMRFIEALAKNDDTIRVIRADANDFIRCLVEDNKAESSDNITEDKPYLPLSGRTDGFGRPTYGPVHFHQAPDGMYVRPWTSPNQPFRTKEQLYNVGHELELLEVAYGYDIAGNQT